MEGTLEVPCYLDKPGCPPGAKFHFEHPWDKVPTQIPGNTQTTAFICNIPRVAVDGAGVKPGRPSLYGHGLLGDPGEVNAGNVQDMSNEHDFVFCATRWSGMADEDIGNAIAILGNFALFPSLTDRLQQGFVAQLFLGRLMIHPNGFSANPAFQDEGRSVIDTRRLFYDGNSQGGIFGGALTALSPDFTRAVLGVPGMNYSHAADAERGLRHLRDDPRPRLPEPAWSGRCCSRWCRCSGTAATPTATRPHHGRPAARHAVAQGAACTWRWATTRWPT